MVQTAEVKTFGQAIRQARLAKGWNQLEAAAALGVHNTTLSLYESNSRVPQIGRVRSICEVLGLDIAEMAQLAFGRPE
jgi:transcriptional regulator with XRE-family HTH domain